MNLLYRSVSEAIMGWGEFGSIDIGGGTAAEQEKRAEEWIRNESVLGKFAREGERRERGRNVERVDGESMVCTGVDLKTEPQLLLSLHPSISSKSLFKNSLIYSKK